MRDQTLLKKLRGRRIAIKSTKCIGGVSMPDLELSETCEFSLAIEKEYGIAVREIKIVDEGSFLISTGCGILSVKRIKDKETHIIYVTGLYDYIRERGFKNILKIYRTKSGKYYMHCLNEIYIVSDCLDGAFKNFSFQGTENKLFKLLALFHRASKGYAPPSGGKTKSNWGIWIEEYKKSLRNIKKHKEKLKANENKTPFEIMFLTSCDIYIDRMEECADILKKGKYLDIVEESMRNREVCIGGFKQSNFYYTKEDISIVSLDKCKYDIREWDIAKLLQKLLEYSTSRSAESLSSLIYVYNEENPLLPDSIDIIKALVLFPGEYNEICLKHCLGKDKWTEGEYMNKLRSAMLMEDKKMNLIKTMESIKL